MMSLGWDVCPFQFSGNLYTFRIFTFFDSVQFLAYILDMVRIVLLYLIYYLIIILLLFAFEYIHIDICAE